MGDSPILSVESLAVELVTPEGTVKPVRDVSFTVNRGEAVGIVGESGSGKSVTVMSLLGLGRRDLFYRLSGKTVFEGIDLVAERGERLREIRGRNIGMVFQDPSSFLNPVMTIGKTVLEAVTRGRRATPADFEKRDTLLRDVGLGPDVATVAAHYPHQLSGGMKQRAMIACALAGDPELLIADEPTTALDATVQKQVLTVMRELQRSRNMAMIFISHDLNVVSQICDKVVVMYAGRVVEKGPVEEVLHNPQHPYTRALIRSSISFQTERGAPLNPIPGEVPDAFSIPPGCAFFPRCPLGVADMCQAKVPAPVHVGPDHTVACVFAGVGGEVEKQPVIWRSIDAPH